MKLQPCLSDARRLRLQYAELRVIVLTFISWKIWMLCADEEAPKWLPVASLYIAGITADAAAALGCSTATLQS